MKHNLIKNKVTVIQTCKMLFKVEKMWVAEDPKNTDIQ